MFNKAKYISYKDHYGIPVIVIFDNSINHNDMANILRIEDDILGAGFTTIDPTMGPICYGYSESLGVKSRDDEDTRLAKRMLMNG